MLKNYLKTATRNLRKSQVYTLINISGLAVGITCCILILLFVRDELSYDRYHKNSDRIYRVAHKRDLSGTFEELPRLPLAATPALLNDFAEVEQAARLLKEWSPVVEFEDKQFVEQRFFFADPAIFDIFDFEFVSGDPAFALQAFNHVVINETIAQKYFGEEDALGKSLSYRKWGQEFRFTVTAVIRPLPSNSHFQIDFLAPFDSEQNMWNAAHGQDWYYVGAWTYLLVRDTQAASKLQRQLPNFVQKHFPEDVKEATTLYLQALPDIHLHSHLDGEIETNGRMAHVYVFSTIAALVLLIACINFMNLTTARSASRAQEVGLRKVVGANRANLISQFVGEAIILSFISVVLSIGLVELFLPFFNNLTGKTLAISYLQDPLILPAIFGMSLFVGLMAGSYPAFYLSTFRPALVLKGGDSVGRGLSLRKLLVIGQFVVSIVLLICIGAISKQVDFMLNRELGFKKEEVLFLRNQPGVKFEAFRNELQNGPGVLQLAGGGSVPGSANASAITWRMFRSEDMEKNQRLQMPSTSVDFYYANVFGLELHEGRYFSEEFTTDATETILVNEAAVREFGWQESPLGKKVEMFNMLGQSDGTWRVIGVVKDYHFESLHERIKPLVLFTNGAANYSNFILRIETADLSRTLEFIERQWKKFAPQFPLQLYFLDSELNGLYAQEQKLQQIVNLFAFLAIFISCLGLYGLSSFSAQKRTKEIGIRKVLGAPVSRIVGLLGREFVLLVALANLLAWPIGYYATSRWLQNFAYRIDIGWEGFALAGGLALIIAFLTVSTQTIRAALANPVESLRYE